MTPPDAITPSKGNSSDKLLLDSFYHYNNLDLIDRIWFTYFCAPNHRGALTLRAWHPLTAKAFLETPYMCAPMDYKATAAK